VKKNQKSLIVLAMLVSAVAVVIRPTGLAFMPLYRKTFTMIGEHVTPELAEWCANLNFTDVWVRYDADPVGSFFNLEQVGIVYYKFLVCSEFVGDSDHSVGRMKVLLEAEIASSPNGRISVDDCNWGWVDGVARDNFLEAVRQLNAGDNVSLVFMVDSVSDLSWQCDWSNLTVDIYHTPMTSLYSILAQMKMNNPESFGLTLWAWGWGGPGDGISSATWATMSQGLIDKKYDEAKTYGASRMIVWNGLEPDGHEAGMSYASLHNYPEWWATIREHNLVFLSS
jgi:hypothetical protein